MSREDQPKKRIGDLLIEDGLITKGMLDQALEFQAENGAKTAESLITLGHLTVDDFINFLSRQPGIASIDLARYHIPSEIIDLISEELAIKHEIFPIDKMGKLLTLGMACPLDSMTIGQIEEDTGLRVKPLLCSQHDILTAIQTYYADPHAEMNLPPGTAAPSAGGVATSKARTGLKLKQASDLIKKLTSLPTLPETVHEVQRAMGDLDVSPKDVADIISQDPPIAAKVLSVANSAAYGFPSRVDSIQLAVALLGLRETYSIVLSAAVINLYEVSKHFDYKTYWEEAMNCAAAARTIGGVCGREKDPCLFTAGLLHDIGRIALLETVPELYTTVPSELEGRALIEAEQKTLGITHTEAGFELAQHWGIPIDIGAPIRHHHHPELATDCRINVAIVALAEAWTRSLADDDREAQSILEMSQPILDLLKLDAEAAAATFHEVSQLERAHFAWEPKETASAQ